MYITLFTTWNEYGAGSKRQIFCQLAVHLGCTEMQMKIQNVMLRNTFKYLFRSIYLFLSNFLTHQKRPFSLPVVATYFKANSLCVHLCGLYSNFKYLFGICSKLMLSLNQMIDREFIWWCVELLNCCMFLIKYRI